MKLFPSRRRSSVTCLALMFSALVTVPLYAEEKAKEAIAPAATSVSPEVSEAKPALIDPKLKESLKLTDAQWTQVEAILVAKEARNRAEMDRHMVAQRLINSQTDAKLAEVLTEEQLTAYFAAERTGVKERLNLIATEIRQRRELRQAGKEATDKK